LYPIKENGKNCQNDHASFDQINIVDILGQKPIWRFCMIAK